MAGKQRVNSAHSIIQVLPSLAQLWGLPRAIKGLGEAVGGGCVLLIGWLGAATASRLGNGVSAGPCWGLGRSGGACSHPGACSRV